MSIDEFLLAGVIYAIAYLILKLIIKLTRLYSQTETKMEYYEKQRGYPLDKKEEKSVIRFECNGIDYGHKKYQLKVIRIDEIKEGSILTNLIKIGAQRGYEKVFTATLAENVFVLLPQESFQQLIEATKFLRESHSKHGLGDKLENQRLIIETDWITLNFNHEINVSDEVWLLTTFHAEEIFNACGLRLENRKTTGEQTSNFIIVK